MKIYEPFHTIADATTASQRLRVWSADGALVATVARNSTLTQDNLETIAKLIAKAPWMIRTITDAGPAVDHGPLDGDNGQVPIKFHLTWRQLRELNALANELDEFSFSEVLK